MKSHIFKLGKAKSKGLGEVQFNFVTGSLVEIEKDTLKRKLTPIPSLQNYPKPFTDFMTSKVVGWDKSREMIEFKSLTMRQLVPMNANLGIMSKEDYIDAKKRHSIRIFNSETNSYESVVRRHPLARRYQSRID